MIIRTQRSLIGLTVDSALTTVGWVGFFYLFTHGVMSLIMPAYPKSGHIAQLAVLMPAIQTLAIYLFILLFNGVLIVLWARYRKSLFKGLIRPETHPTPLPAAVAEHFHLMPTQLHDIHDSRVTVIYHSDNGDINHLEIDRLEEPPPQQNAIYLVGKTA